MFGKLSISGVGRVSSKMSVWTYIPMVQTYLVNCVFSQKLQSFWRKKNIFAGETNPFVAQQMIICIKNEWHKVFEQVQWKPLNVITDNAIIRLMWLTRCAMSQITLSKVFHTRRDSLIVIIRIMLSLSLCPKVIILSGLHCICGQKIWGGTKLVPTDYNY